MNHFCLPGWVWLGNQMVCEVVIEGGRATAIVVCTRFSSGFIYELLLVRRRNEQSFAPQTSSQLSADQ